MSDMKNWLAKIDEVVGTNWSAPRARLYIAAELEVLSKACNRLQKELDFEKAVNDKVRKIFENSISHAMKNALNQVTLNLED